jgi:hypothetical protein
MNSDKRNRFDESPELGVASNERRIKRHKIPGSAVTFPPLLLKESEAAKLLSVSSRVLWGLTNKGLINCIWLGNSKRYSIAELERFVQQEQEKANQSRRC